MPNWTQLVIPAIEKLAASPKAEQTARLMQGMERVTGPSLAAETPWQRLMKMLPKGRSPEGLQFMRSPEAGGVDILMRRPGYQTLEGSISEGRNPYEAFIGHLRSRDTRRASIGDPETGIEEFKLNIESPAQRKLPLREKLPASEKTARAPRKKERRWHDDMIDETGVKPFSTAEKQGAFDTVARMLRESGHKSLKFAAEPGERERLYEKLSGYKPEPTGASQMDILNQMLRGMPARMTQTPSAARQSVATRQGAPMHVTSLENMLGLSAEEAVEYGLAQRVGQSSLYNLTDRGRRMSTVDWFGGQ